MTPFFGYIVSLHCLLNFTDSEILIFFYDFSVPNDDDSSNSIEISVPVFNVNDDKSFQKIIEGNL